MAKIFISLIKRFIFIPIGATESDKLEKSSFVRFFFAYNPVFI